MSQLQVNRINDESGGVLAPISSVMRNRIINGAMVIDQRNAGASATVAGNYNTVDRFKCGNNTNAGTIQRITSTLAGFQHSVKYTAAGTTTFFQFGQQIELSNCFDLQNQSVTISFRAKANNSNSGSTALIVRTRTVAGVDGAALFAGSNVDTNVTITTSDTLYSVTRSLPATFGALSVEFVLDSHVSGDGFEITGVQLEKGTQATSFEYRHYQQELDLCYRYAVLLGTTVGGYAITIGRGMSNGSSSGWRTMIQVPSPMRATPSLTPVNLLGWNVSNSAVGLSSIATVYMINGLCLETDINYVSSVGSSNSQVYLQTNGSGGASYLLVSAEL